MHVRLFFFFLCSSLSAAELEPTLKRYLWTHDSAPVVVHLKGQLKLTPLPARQLAIQLEKFTEEKSKEVIQFLHSKSAEGVIEIVPLWITNSVKVTASANTIRRVSVFSTVESILLDEAKPVGELDSMKTSSSERLPINQTTAWGVSKVRAPDLWHKNIEGDGVVVAVIDSGVNVKHPDLASSIWLNPGESGKDKATNGIDDDGNGFIDDISGWNFGDEDNDLSDLLGHGTEVAGVIAGTGKGGIQTGVAPKAKLMILKTGFNSTRDVFESSTWEAFQYAIKMGANIISMSLTLKDVKKPNHRKWRRADEVLLAAGIVHVNSAGNEGSRNTPHNIGAPAMNPPAWRHPTQALGGLASMITVGATNSRDEWQDYSSSGPVTWENIDDYKDYIYQGGMKSGLIKPDLCGPGDVPSTSNDGKAYTKSFDGSSSAAPHVTGVAALLLSAFPKLTVAQVTEALQNSAVVVERNFNNHCGAGRVDSVAALEYVKAHF